MFSHAWPHWGMSLPFLACDIIRPVPGQSLHTLSHEDPGGSFVARLAVPVHHAECPTPSALLFQSCRFRIDAGRTGSTKG